MYEISFYSDKIRNTITNIVFKNDSTDENYPSYLEWLKKENTPIFVDCFDVECEEKERSLLPKVVSQRQLRTQLVLNGFDLNSVQLAINELTEPNKSVAQIAWDYAITFERDSPLLMCLATNLGLTQQQVDEIFLNASKL